MPDRRRHRGPHPEDRDGFSLPHRDALRRAVADLSWLLGHGYADVAARKLVGDRFGLTRRQRLAVQRAACAEPARVDRLRRRVPGAAVAGRPLWIDGFNVLITVETALAGGVLLRCRDGCVRDMASLHGTYRTVDETVPAAAALCATIGSLAPAGCRVLLDRPVSNSGRVRAALAAEAARQGTVLDVELGDDVDRALRTAPDAVVIATADAGILDRCGAWFDLATATVARHAPDTDEVPLDPPLSGGDGAS